MDQSRTPFWTEMSPTPTHQHPQAQFRNRVRESSQERTSSSYQCCEGNFNFSTAQGEDDDFYHKKKMSRDPMSHRIIEKRRRDRMNNCLADLSRLIPTEYLKKGRGRVEKTEIIEMAIKHLQHLQRTAYSHNPVQVPVAFPPTAPPSQSDSGVSALAEGNGATSCSTVATASGSCIGTATQNGDPSASVNGSGSANGSANDSLVCTSGPTTNSASNSGSSNNGWDGEASDVPLTPAEAPPTTHTTNTSVRPIITEHYRLGYQECVSEAMHFLVEVEGYFACDALCVRLVNHLQRHCDRIVKGDRLNFPRSRKPGEASSSSGSSTSGVCSGNMCAASSAATAPSTSNEDFGDPNGQMPVPAHSYKFKNTIKQRFSDDQQERRHKRQREGSTSPSPPGSRSPSPSKRSPSPPRLEAPPVARTETAAVPIFVLHSKGSFYVPLTVAYDVLAPYLDRLDPGPGLPFDTGPTSPRPVSPARPASVLHPVTISVNFSQCPTQTQRVAPPPGQLAISLHPHSPGHGSFASPPVGVGCPGSEPSWAPSPYAGNG